MISALVSRRLLVNALAVSAVGIVLAVAMQAARVLAPLVAARASAAEVALALGAVALLAAPSVVVVASGLAAALTVTGLAADGARDALSAHGIGPARAVRSALPASVAIAGLALVLAAILEPIAVRIVLDRAAGLAERAVVSALEGGQILPLGDEGAIATTTSGAERTLTIVTGPSPARDRRSAEGARVASLRAELIGLRFPDEARLGRGHLSFALGGEQRVRLSFRSARWPIGPDVLVGAPRQATRSIVPDRRLARTTLDGLAHAGTDADSLALVARRALPALLAFLACVAPFAIGWPRRRPGLGLVVACGVAPAVLGLGVARALDGVRPAAAPELCALAAFALALSPWLVASTFGRARGSKSA